MGYTAEAECYSIARCEMTLLERFILKKRSEYMEPPRSGFKGNIPGRISCKKHHTALLQLTGRTQATIAQMVGVSHRLALKWRTEEGYRDLVAHLVNEFSLLFFGRIHEIIQDYPPWNLPKNIRDEFADAADYSDALILHIFTHLTRLDRGKFIDQTWPVFLIFKHLLLTSPQSGLDFLVETSALTIRGLGLSSLMDHLKQISPSNEASKRLLQGFLHELLNVHMEMINRFHEPGERSRGTIREESRSCWNTRLLIIAQKQTGRTLDSKNIDGNKDH